MNLLDGKTFLVVDDSRLTRINTIYVLEKLGNNIKTYNAETGLDALNLLESPGINIDCIISDFHMPVMHGLQLLKAVRMGCHNICNDYPFVLLTTYTHMNLVTLGMVLDIDAYIIKPPSEEVLREKLTEIFETEDSERIQFTQQDYRAIDVDQPIEEIDINSIKICLEKGHISIKQTGITEESSLDNGTSGTKAYAFEEIPIGSVLARDAVTKSGRVVMFQNMEFTKTVKKRVISILDLGEELDWVFVKNK